ncbi:tRNA guanosine(15) transglycosylase TgtA [Methanobacterium formicicum]|uniref:tRNA-guanine(15) transglycosylase n=1 Tax=Methanobacterium formicicum (strain DSM 3637 / PP1) TaxID=1204725 RepID=K2RUP8_METFP|nr:tRNA guanosine(15) transglycosylase TgtA [Methanobacterium formicicum]EKF86495.1 7-cyano-7-deazaguanine tRNA-ribosyltransferase [Methanobacterium formicicum DSM 3637]
MSFEIKYKDARGRVGTLKTPHGTIKTPALMPVIHPGKQTLQVADYGAEVVITNAYLIYKNEDLREIALNEGVHELIDFPGPIITDSGSFQLSVYGDVQVSNQEIIEFQEKIGTDIGTSLDIPTPPSVKRERAERELEITLQRAIESLEVRDELMLNSVVQGSTFPDLRSKCADALGEMDFQVHPIGAVVPLMESYRYKELVEVVMASVSHLPDSRPRHLMGAGHPMIFALAVAMGCDLFDSAAYILYAEADRLLMPNGTLKLENLYEMPCSCEVCTNYTPEQLRQMEKPERSKLLAIHNLRISFAEMRMIRQAIVEGSLWELVEQRCRAHPFLLEALRTLKNYSEDLEKYDPPYKKSAFFYTGPESLHRPEVYRHLKKMKQTPPKKSVLLLPRSGKPYSERLYDIPERFYRVIRQQESLDQLEDMQVTVVDVPFGVIPLELDQVYPLAQNESPDSYDEDSLKMVRNILSDYLEGFDQVIISEEVVEAFSLNKKYPLEEYHFPQPLNIVVNEQERIKMIADYQFGAGSGEGLFSGDVKIVKSRKTGKIRHVYDDEELIATLRASDGVFVLAREGARRLHRYLPYPKNRVVVNEDAEPFAREGKSIFAKFVINCDIDIHAKEEVLIVNEQDQLLAFGKSILNGREILDFNTGQAVKTRKGGF